MNENFSTVLYELSEMYKDVEGCTARKHKGKEIQDEPAEEIKVT